MTDTASKMLIVNKDEPLAVPQGDDISAQLTAKSEAEIVLEALGGRLPASVDTLEWFNERIPKKLKLKNRQSIHDWTIEKYNPSHLYLNTLVIFYAEGDPRRVMAEQILEMRRNAIRAHWIGEAKAKAKS